MIQWYKRAGDGPMPKNKEGMLLRYRETCGRVMTGSYAPFVTDPVTSTSSSRPRPLPRVPTMNQLNQKNYAAAVLAPVQEPEALSLEPAAASILVSAADLVSTVAVPRGVAAAAGVIVASEPKATQDTDASTDLLDDEWGESLVPWGPTDSEMPRRRFPIDESYVDHHLPSFHGHSSEDESSDEESAFDITGL